jgi:hypothetical protein
MKCFSPASRAALTFLTVLAFAIPVVAKEQVPFRGSLEGDVAVTPIDPPLIVAVVISGTGNASHLGQFAISIPHVVNRGTRTGAGVYQFTAANGDTVTADFTGESAPTDTPGVLAIVEVATITSGTGRFAGATGSFTVTRLYDTAAGTTTGTFEGTISSPGSQNR